MIQSASSPAWHFDGPLVLAGCGKMGGAMLAGWIDAGLDPAAILIQEPNPSAELAAYCAAKGISLAAVQKPSRAPSVLIMAVKPQAMDAVFPPLAALTGPKTVTLSIAAGKTIASFERNLSAGAAVVRAMPNTPAAIGRGMTVLCANPAVTVEQRALCERLMAAAGETGWVEDEELMDAVTAVSGSGPAYVFLLAEALAAAGVKAGLPPDLSARLARVTVAGSGELIRRSPDTPASTLRENVTSPGGTTAAALAVLMAGDGMPSLLERAIAAATARGKALRS